MLKPEDKAKLIELTDINGDTFSLESVKGKKVLLTFFRFAGCPFCNLRVQQLIQNREKLGDSFAIVGVFDATLKNLQKNLSKHNAPFTLLADKENIAYKAYGVQRSIMGVLIGMIKHFPSLLKSMFIKRNIPTNFGGSLLTMPANFLINEQGIIEVAHYGKDEFDHLPFEDILAFAQRP